MPGDAGSRLIITAGRLASEIMLFLTMIVILSAGSPPLLAAGSSTLDLDELIREALSRNPELLVSESKVSASGYRIPQAKSLPDPMFMFGYQNEGFRQITIGEEANAMGMLSLSQMFPFFGKLDLKGQMAAKDAESLKSMHKATQLKTVATVKQLYYELFVAYKNIEVLKKLADYFSRIEDAATARYASGMGSRQEIVMAQTERYMLLEKEEMQRQKIEVLQGMLNNTLGREENSPLGRPVGFRTPLYLQYRRGLQMAKSNSPEIESRKRMAEAAEARVKMAKKEYYPDTTLGVGYFPKTKGMLDMWNVTVTVNIPIFYKTKQEQAVLEAESGLLGASANWRLPNTCFFGDKREPFHGPVVGKIDEALQGRPDPEDVPGFPARPFRLCVRQDGGDNGHFPAQGAPRYGTPLLVAVCPAREGNSDARCDHRKDHLGNGGPG